MGYGRLAGIDAPVNVDRGKFHFGFANPSGVARMAYLGRGSYKKKMALRAIGVFPSWDRLVFAVRADTGIHSIEEIKATRFPAASLDANDGKSLVDAVHHRRSVEGIRFFVVRHRIMGW